MAPSVLHITGQQYNESALLGVQKKVVHSVPEHDRRVENILDNEPVYMFYESKKDAVDGKNQRLSYLSNQGFTCDQDWPVDVMHICTPSARAGDKAPVLLIGGMGPAAGFEAFEHLVNRLGDTHEVLLFQACFTPDRTRAVAGLESREEVVSCLRNAIIFASKLFTNPEESKTVMVSCNTAHIFFTEALLAAEEIDHTLDLTHVSLIDSTVSAVARLDEPVLLLSTNGTRANRLYSERLETAGAEFVEPNAEAQEMLHQLIVDGIKGGNDDVVSEVGDLFCHTLFNNPNEENPFTVIGGCTEIPIIFNRLQESSDPTVRRLSRRVTVINPFHEATERLATLERDTSVPSSRDNESRMAELLHNGKTLCSQSYAGRISQRRNTVSAAGFRTRK